MKKAAIAVLTHRYMGNPPSNGYSYTPSAASAPKTMRTIEVKTKAGKPLKVLQSEDTPLAIEKILRENGWSIVAWNGDLLQLGLIPANVPLNSKPSSAPQGKSVNVKAGIGCLALLIVMLLLFGACGVIVSTSSGDDGPDVGNEHGASYACEDKIKTLLNAPSTAIFSNQKWKQQEADPTAYTVTGFVESENPLGGIKGYDYGCNVKYDPTIGEYTLTTTIVDGKVYP